MPAGVSAYVPLANITLGANAATVTFSSISQIYRDLVLVIDNVKTVSGTYNMNFRFNGISTTTYNYVNAYGNGSTTGSISQANLTEGNISGGTDFLEATTPWLGLANIMDYSATDKHKTVISRGNRSNNGVSMIANRWASTAAITSITLAPEFTGSFAAGSTFALYGVSA